MVTALINHSMQLELQRYKLIVTFLTSIKLYDGVVRHRHFPSYDIFTILVPSTGLDPVLAVLHTAVLPITPRGHIFYGAPNRVRSDI
jgi:hypothetical protein